MVQRRRACEREINFRIPVLCFYPETFTVHSLAFSSATCTSKHPYTALQVSLGGHWGLVTTGNLFSGGPGFPTADPDKALRSWRPSQQKNQMNSVKNSLLPENLSMDLAFFLESQGYSSGLHTRQPKSPQTHILLTSQNRSLARRVRALPLRVR